MSPDPKCANCDDAVSLLKVVAALITSNAQITTELAGLHAALARLAVAQSSVPTLGTSSATEAIMTVSDGRGAASMEVYREICKGNWHGRLGRTHMVDVDRMLESRRRELDSYLLRTIKPMFPIDAAYTSIDPDAIFVKLSAFGLRMEDRGPLAETTFFADSTVIRKPTVTRLRNWTAHLYTSSTEKFEEYWKASAMETVTELARYRGLFTAEGWLKDVK